MKVRITLFFIIAGFITAITFGLNNNSKIDYLGTMPEVVVTAPRYTNQEADSIGLMPEVLVTALRYEYEDEAWSGLMEEVVVTAKSFDDENVVPYFVLSEIERVQRSMKTWPFEPTFFIAPAGNSIRSLFLYEQRDSCQRFELRFGALPCDSA